LEEWPQRLDGRRKFVNIAIIDDLDTPEDSPEFPRAAGMEPTFIFFGGDYASEEEAKAVAKNDIGPWCRELIIDTVEKHGWLWPSEVDQDKITEEHRTGNAESNAELSLIMKERQNQMGRAEEARAEVRAGHLSIAEINANSVELPDVGASGLREPGVIQTRGAIQQLSREETTRLQQARGVDAIFGAPILDVAPLAEAPTPLAEPETDLPDAFSLVSTTGKPAAPSASEELPEV
jgi:hypothetical protein